jgi:HEPN domain-containing protein
MPHDPARVEDTLAWLTRALSDLRAGAHQLTATPPFTRHAVFHAQQTAEKAFKAFLAWHDDPFPKTHDLARLGRQCSEIDPAFAPVAVEASTLTDYAWKYRVPRRANRPASDRG